MSIPRDVQEFLDEYPDLHDNPSEKHNLQFYSDGLRCRPDGLTISEIHKKWFGDYDKLEYKHGYIQWLFPIQEYGMNYESQPLYKHELEKMKTNPIIIDRIVESYKLMLDFYGMRLVSKETGLLERSLPPRNYATRYRNLVRASHNNLRISRILKCLSEMGLEHLNAGFLLHVLNEQSESKELNTSAIRSSMDRWWANCLRNEEERTWIGDLIRKARLAKDGFVFTREEYEKALQRRAETGHLGFQGIEPQKQPGPSTEGHLQAADEPSKLDSHEEPLKDQDPEH